MNYRLVFHRRTTTCVVRAIILVFGIMCCALFECALAQPLPQAEPQDVINSRHQQDIELLRQRADTLEKDVKQLSDKDSALRKDLSDSGITKRTDVHQIEIDVATLKEAIKRLDPLLQTGTREQIAQLQASVQRIDDVLARLRQGRTPQPSATAEGEKPPATAAPVANGELGTALNIVWTLVAGFLVMFMQAGFAMVETGFVRKKNAAHTMAMNLMIYSLAVLGYWMCGFAFQMGGTGAASSVSTVSSLGPEIGRQLSREFGFSVGGKFFGLLGGAGFFLPSSMLEGGVFALFLFQLVFMDTAATIPTGAMAERWKFRSFCWYSLAAGAVIYPIYANWVWGGGWLAAMGKNFSLGHGVVDFAGSSVVHLCGGTIAFVGARMLGRRRRATNDDGARELLRPHNVPFAMLGTFILAFGWFGFNAGSTLAGMNTHIGIIATNTALASAAGSAAAMIATWHRFGLPDPTFMCNGMLAGLVAITLGTHEEWTAVA